MSRRFMLGIGAGSWRSLWLAASLAAGSGAVYWVMRQTGVAATCEAIRGAFCFLPLLLALEGFRIATEVMAAKNLFHLVKASVPNGALIKAQLVGYSICNVVPVGRMASEAAKAGILRSHAPLAKTVAIATIAQALHLVASAVILVPCVVAARSTGASWGLSMTIASQCALLAAIGGALLLVSYFAPLGTRALRRLPRLARALEQFRSAMRELPRFPMAALGWLVLNRVFQVSLIAIMIRAVGSWWSLAGSFVAEAVVLIGASAGDVVPGQIGALEGAFSFFADAVGTTRRQGVALALLIHLIQLAWVLVGFVVLALGRPKVRPTPEGDSGRSVRALSSVAGAVSRHRRLAGGEA